MIRLSDVRYALRLWRRHPTMVVVAGLSLGLGVGATSTMYSVVNRVSHYELGFADANRLTVLWSANAEKGIREQPPNWEIVRALLEHGQSFEGFGFFQGNGAPVTMSGTTETSRVSQMPVDVNALSIVGVRPFLGRTYRLEDFDDVVKQKEARAIVVSYDTWQRRLGGAPDVVGRSIRIDEEPRTIIGVMPRGFALVPWEDNIAFWAANDLRRIPEARWMIAVGRLKPGVSIGSAQSEATAITRQLIEARGEKPGGAAARVVSLHEAFFGDATKGLTFLLGAVSFVLLIACANVANLLLAAGTARQKELALRAAAGAGRGRLMQQLLTENLLLSLVGCGFGLALAFWGTRLFALIVPTGFPELLRHITVDARVLGFALAISIASSVVFGLMPALRASRVDLNDVLKEGARGSSGGGRRGRSALLVAEVALSMVLLVGAGLMMRGFLREQRDLPGFDTTRLLTADILLGGTKYFDKTPQDMNLVTPQSEMFFDQLLERVRALPGVTRAGIISRLPMEVWTHPFVILGRPAPEHGKEPLADLNEVDAQALDTLGIRLLRGRMIQERDVASTPWVAVVNKTFVDRHFPGQDPVGQAIRISIGPSGDGAVREPQPRQIVGVVADVTYPSFFSETPAAVYIPFRQHLSQYGREDEWIHTRKVLAIRTSVDPLTLVRGVQDAVAHVDRDQAAHDFMTMEQRVASSPSVTNSRFFASLFTAFGTLAILLAMVGVYGVMSWVVGQRTTEFGIRMALGARARDVVAMLLGQSLKPIVLGVVLGVAGGFGLSRVLNNLFWRMAVADPLVLGAISTLMLIVALTAAWIPVHRVTRIDPQHALRHG
ncbi:MAG TPA: ABC transporter permease [Vicinamibacterales bacterium]|nr:ABC transporter permease [Vicinamibacterales bacterium]